MQIDLVTAMGRLLSDGDLRRAFSADPEAVANQFCIQSHDRAAFLGLVPHELEFQAEILLRKRFGEIQRLLPQTLVQLDEEAWQLFRKFGHGKWPKTSPQPIHHAHAFCEYLAREKLASVCALESNRLRFVLGRRRVAMHFIGSAAIRGKRRRALQLLARDAQGRLREFLFHFGLS